MTDYTITIIDERIKVTSDKIHGCYKISCISEELAKLFVAAPKMLKALQDLVNHPLFDSSSSETDVLLGKACDAIEEATE